VLIVISMTTTAVPFCYIDGRPRCRAVKLNAASSCADLEQSLVSTTSTLFAMYRLE